MAEEKHHHHLFHHKKEGEEAVDTSVYSESAYSSSTDYPGSEGYGAGLAKPEVDYKKEEKHHKHLEHLGELGSAAAGAYAVVMFSSIFNLSKLIREYTY